MTASSRAAWLALFVVAFGANVPVPLLLVYREDLALSSATVTLVFGVYAAGVIPALLLAGPASDRYGRLRLVLPFTGLAAVASVVFVAADGVEAALFVGRFLQGVASGVVFSVGSAWMHELSRREGRSGERRTTSALSAGFALGAVVAGSMGAWAPWPTVSPFLVHLAAAAAVLAALAGAVEVRVAGPRTSLRRLGVPRGSTGRFATDVVPLALWVFAFPTTSINAIPVLLDGADGRSRVALAGLVAGITMVAGALVQPFGRHAGTRPGAGGLTLGAAGLAVGIASLSLSSWLVLLPACVLLGASYGLCLAAGLARAQAMADPAMRAALTATFYAVAYAGMAAPFVIIEASAELGQTTTLAAAAALALASAVWIGARSGHASASHGLAARMLMPSHATQQRRKPWT